MKYPTSHIIIPVECLGIGKRLRLDNVKIYQTHRSDLTAGADRDTDHSELLTPHETLCDTPSVTPPTTTVSSPWIWQKRKLDKALIYNIKLRFVINQNTRYSERFARNEG